MAIEFKNVAKRVFHIDHAIRLFTGVVLAHLLHALLATKALNDLDPAFQIVILHTEMKQPATPVFKRAFLIDGFREFEQFDTNPVPHRQVRNAELPQAITKNVIAHLTDGAVVIQYFSMFHQDIKPERLGV